MKRENVIWIRQILHFPDVRDICFMELEYFYKNSFK